MGNKELYELKRNSIKTKYRTRIDDLKEKNEVSLDTAKALMEEALAEVKAVKKDKYDRIRYYQKSIRMYTIIADILLFIGLLLFSGGLFVRLRYNPESVVWVTLAMVLGGILMISAGCFFGYVMWLRDRNQEYLKDSVSETELVSTKTMVTEFYESVLENENHD